MKLADLAEDLGGRLRADRELNARAAHYLIIAVKSVQVLNKGGTVRPLAFPSLPCTEANLVHQPPPF